MLAVNFCLLNFPNYGMRLIPSEIITDLPLDHLRFAWNFFFLHIEI